MPLPKQQGVLTRAIAASTCSTSWRCFSINTLGARTQQTRALSATPQSRAKSPEMWRGCLRPWRSAEAVMMNDDNNDGEGDEEALPCPALPCAALPCPNLPCFCQCVKWRSPSNSSAAAAFRVGPEWDQPGQATRCHHNKEPPPSREGGEARGVSPRTGGGQREWRPVIEPSHPWSSDGSFANEPVQRVGSLKWTTRADCWLGAVYCLFACLLMFR